jgi:hypothetical protein
MAEKLRVDPVETPELQNDRELLAKMRARRWKALRASFPSVRADIADWAVRMEALHGPRVKIWENLVGWVTALYIARYGENEAYWPEELTDDDLTRALAWERGNLPQTVRYLDLED